MGIKPQITDAKRRVLAKAQSTINVDMAYQASVRRRSKMASGALLRPEGDIFSDPDLRPTCHVRLPSYLTTSDA